MKKVLFVISTLDTGGAQRALSNIVTHLPDDYHIDILLNDDVSIKYPYKGNILTLGMKPEVDKMGLIYQLKVFIKRVHRIKDLKRSGKYDACISFLDSANYANILSGSKYCKTIISVRVNLTRTAETIAKYKYIVKPLAKYLYNKADKVVAVSKGTAVDLRNELNIKNEKIVTIYNGYDIDEIQEKSQMVNHDDDNELGSDNKFVITTMGRLETSKGHWHLINAISLLPEEIKSQICLKILGDGPLKDDLIQLSIKHGLQENVRFMGFQINPFAIISKSDLFVFPSLIEGFPNALAEAMCCGLPVVASDCESGVREILAPNTDVSHKAKEMELAEYGVIVPAGGEFGADCDNDLCEESLVMAMEMMIYDTSRRENYSKKGFERAQQLSIESVVEQWLKVIEEER